MGAQNSGKTTAIKALIKAGYNGVVEPLSQITHAFGDIDINGYNPYKIGLNDQTDIFSQLAFVKYYNSVIDNYRSSEGHIITDRCALDTIVYWNNNPFFVNHFDIKLIFDLRRIEQNEYLQRFFGSELLSFLANSYYSALDFYDKFIFVESGAFDIVDDGVRDARRSVIQIKNRMYSSLYQGLNFSKKAEYINVDDIKLNNNAVYDRVVELLSKKE